MFRANINLVYYFLPKREKKSLGSRSPPFEQDDFSMKRHHMEDVMAHQEAFTDNDIMMPLRTTNQLK